MEVVIKLNKIWFFIFFIFLISCGDGKKEKFVYYKRLDKENKQIGFSIRKYYFSFDTIKMEYKKIDNQGKRIGISYEEYMNKNGNLYIFSNVANDNTKYLFFIKEKDTCIDVRRHLDAFSVCNKTGKLDKKDNYHLVIDYSGYYFQRDSLILDKDFSIIEFIRENEETYIKEVLINEKNINDNIKNELQKEDDIGGNG